MKKIQQHFGRSTRSFVTDPLYKHIHASVYDHLCASIKNPVNNCIWEYNKVCTFIRLKEDKL